MAEGFEPYHVPQQSRRDKLRVVNHQHQDTLQTCASLLPLYDPSSLIPSDFISCAAANLQRHPYNIAVKEEGMGINLMGFVDGMSTSHDPHQSVHLNPSSTIQDVNSTSYVYASSPHCYQPFHGDQLAQTSAGGQSLSLSLSSHCSNLNLPLELNMHRYDSSPVFTANKVSDGYLVSCNGGEGGAAAVEFSKSSVPLGPFTGYASVLRGSRFLKPAQQLLEELCDVGRGIYAEKNGVDSSLLDPPPLETLSGSEIIDDSVNGGDQNGKKSRLLSMLDEVYKWYKQYYQQMQAAVAAFESVAGLSNAAPFANMALNVMSKHFRCLRNAIADQLQQFSSKPHGKMNSDRDENSSWRPFHADQPVWRPQRGLPERAVTVLRAWLFEHFLHPYPTDTDKVMLAKQTGLSRNQVSNWFINARVRLWKPMVEEIHMLETRQGQKPSQIVEHPALNSVLDDHLPPSCSVECEDASTSAQRTGDFPLKRSREEGSAGAMGQMKLPYHNHHHHHMGVVGLSNGNGNAGAVSLTLGLHQNDPYPLNAARRFGLDSQGVVSESRQFGRPMMHDFVG